VHPSRPVNSGEETTKHAKGAKRYRTMKIMKDMKKERNPDQSHPPSLRAEGEAISSLFMRSPRRREPCRSPEPEASPRFWV
jgi:hypothetical protein